MQFFFLFYIDLTLLEQVIGTLGGVQNIKQLNLLTTKHTKKMDLSRISFNDQNEFHHMLQLAASRSVRYLVLHKC